MGDSPIVTYHPIVHKIPSLLHIDTHQHTSESYDNAHVPENSPQAVTSAQAKKGLLKLVSDHDTIRGIGYSNVPAVEIKFLPKKGRYLVDVPEPFYTMHFNVFGFTTSEYEEITRIIPTGDLDELVGYFQSNDLPWQFNHPSWAAPEEKLNIQQMHKVARHYAHVVELNAGRPKYANDVSIMLAKMYNLGLTGGTDGHVGTNLIGRSYVVAHGADFREAWEHIAASDATVVRYDATARDIAWTGTTMIRQFLHDERLHVEEPISLSELVEIWTTLKIPFSPHMILKSIELTGRTMIGEAAAQMFYIGPTNRESKKILNENLLIG